MATQKQIEITLVRGRIGLTEIQELNLRGLGLKHRHQTVLREDTPAVRGMIKKVIHLVSFQRPNAETKKAEKKVFVEILPGEAPKAAPKAKKSSKKKES